MKLYITKTPKSIQRIFSQYLWRFSSDKKEIYLTFDDGPTPEITNFVLEQLRKFEAKATFFLIGKNAKKYPELYQQILNENHAIGNHTHNHFNGFRTKTKEYLKNVLETENVICNTNENSRIKLFRPPYGRIKSKQAKEIKKLGYKIIMWSVLSADFDVTISKEKCLQNVLKNTQNGSIIVFHDSVKASEKLTYVLPKVLEFYTEKGFTFKAIS